MDLFRKALPPSSQVAQANPIAAQKTAWLVHLHPQLRENVEPCPRKAWSSSHLAKSKIWPSSPYLCHYAFVHHFFQENTYCNGCLWIGDREENDRDFKPLSVLRDGNDQKLQTSRAARDAKGQHTLQRKLLQSIVAGNNRRWRLKVMYEGEGGW
jgi:hypothetical protein